MYATCPAMCCACTNATRCPVVCGEIMSFADLKEYGTEAAVKAAGKLAQKGKPYEMVDGDIAHWKHG